MKTTLARSSINQQRVAARQARLANTRFLSSSETPLPFLPAGWLTVTLNSLVPPPEGALLASFPKGVFYALIRVGGTEQRTPYLDANSQEQLLGLGAALVFEIPHLVAVDRGQQVAIEVYDASDGSDAGVLYASASVPVSKILRQGDGLGGSKGGKPPAGGPGSGSQVVNGAHPLWLPAVVERAPTRNGRPISALQIHALGAGVKRRSGAEVRLLFNFKSTATKKQAPRGFVRGPVAVFSDRDMGFLIDRKEHLPGGGGGGHAEGGGQSAPAHPGQGGSHSRAGAMSRPDSAARERPARPHSAAPSSGGAHRQRWGVLPTTLSGHPAFPANPYVVAAAALSASRPGTAGARRDSRASATGGGLHSPPRSPIRARPQSAGPVLSLRRRTHDRRAGSSGEDEDVVLGEDEALGIEHRFDVTHYFNDHLAPAGRTRSSSSKHRRPASAHGFVRGGGSTDSAAVEREALLLNAIEGRLGQIEGRLMGAMLGVTTTERKREEGKEEGMVWPRDISVGGDGAGGAGGERRVSSRPQTAPRMRPDAGGGESAPRKRVGPFWGDDKEEGDSGEESATVLCVPISQPAPLHDPRMPRVASEGVQRLASGEDLHISSSGKSILEGFEHAITRLEVIEPLVGVNMSQVAELIGTIFANLRAVRVIVTWRDLSDAVHFLTLRRFSDYEMRMSRRRQRDSRGRGEMRRPSVMDDGEAIDKTEFEIMATELLYQAAVEAYTQATSRGAHFDVETSQVAVHLRGVLEVVRQAKDPAQGQGSGDTVVHLIPWGGSEPLRAAPPNKVVEGVGGGRNLFVPDASFPGSTVLPADLVGYRPRPRTGLSYLSNKKKSGSLEKMMLHGKQVQMAAQMVPPPRPLSQPHLPLSQPAPQPPRAPLPSPDTLYTPPSPTAALPHPLSHAQTTTCTYECQAAR